MSGRVQMVCSLCVDVQLACLSGRWVVHYLVLLVVVRCICSVMVRVL